MPSGCWNWLSHMLIQSRCWLCMRESGPRTPVLESANGQKKPSWIGRSRVTGQHNEKRIKWRSMSGRLPNRWVPAMSKAPAMSNEIFQSIVSLLWSLIRHLTGWFRHCTWQTRLYSIARISRLCWTSSWWLAIVDRGILWTNPGHRSGIWLRVLCMSSLPFSFCSPWWWVHTEDNEDDTLSHWSLPIKVCCDTLTNVLCKPCSLTIFYVDSYIAGEMVGDHNSQLFWCH
jgi:hypothetical protein